MYKYMKLKSAFRASLPPTARSTTIRNHSPCAHCCPSEHLQRPGTCSSNSDPSLSHGPCVPLNNRSPLLHVPAACCESYEVCARPQEGQGEPLEVLIGPSAFGSSFCELLLYWDCPWEGRGCWRATMKQAISMALCSSERNTVRAIIGSNPENDIRSHQQTSFRLSQLFSSGA